MPLLLRRRPLALLAVFVLIAGILVGYASPARAAAVDSLAQQNARALLDSGRLTFQTNSTQSQIRAYADGYEWINPATNRACNINDVLLDALKKVIVDQRFSVRVVSLNRWCEGRDPTAWWQYHIVNGGGHAVDIVRVNGVASTGGTYQDEAFVRSMASVLPTPAGVGQLNCNQQLELPKGWTRFNDTCDHLHLEYRGADVRPTPGSTAVVPVYRFWSPNLQSHFYTADPVERDRVITIWPQIWSYEGQRYTAFTSQVPGTVPLYRFWSAKLGGHFYTADAAERDGVIARQPDVWGYEGVAYYVYPVDSTAPNTVTVARFWGPVIQHHFYTASSVERDRVMALWPQIWSYEGERFRVPAGGIPPE